jgi:ATP-binding cassette subfamily C (CFTR/MRP) protein 1
MLGVHFLRKFVQSSVKKSTIGETRYPVSVVGKVGYGYKLSLVCSILVMVAHFILTLMPVKGHICESTVKIRSQEITQVISWAIVLIAMYKIVKENHTIFPWILRAWWVCNFLLYLYRIAIDGRQKLVQHQRLRTEDWVDFFIFVASTCLMGIAIKGKTGNIHHGHDDSVDPLLDTKTDERKRQCLYGTATFLQLITFSWLNPLFSVGYKKTLNQDEVPDVYVKDSAEFLSHAFDESLKFVKEKYENPTIYKAMYVFIRRKAAINALFAIITAATSYIGPYLINDLVDFLSNKKNRSLTSGYFLALAFLGAKMVETVAQRQWIFGARQLGLRLRAALISHIYKKGLVLSSKSCQTRTSGEIINYMSVDVQRITDFIWYLNIIFMLPIQISLAMLILQRNLGLGSVVGLVTTLMVMTINVPVTRFQKGYQSKIMDAKDSRMKATSEILRNIKALKLQAWDTRYLKKLESLRKTEYDWLWKSLRLSAISAFIFWGSPAVISVATFCGCALMRVPLTAGRVLSALATFRMLQEPIYNLPDLLSVIAQAKVSADRVSSYLEEDEIKFDSIEYIPPDQTDLDVEISNGAFSWDIDSRTPTLEAVNLEIKKGMKVAICGTVGSGKSSLLLSILGEVEKLSGTVKVSGTKAYVPQSPWILTGNVRENILFGNVYEKSKYERTVEACALIKDFELFSTGDLTEIGERGINMSGGQKQRIQIARAVYEDADIYLLDDPFSAVDAHTGTQLFEECIMGILKKKTILYVTHQVEFLPAADLILVMQNGRIAQSGTFQELMKQNIGFELLVGAHNEALESVLTVESTSRTAEHTTPNADPKPEQPKPISDQTRCAEITEKDGRLVSDEEREEGGTGKEVYLAYLKIVKHGFLVPIILLAQSSFQVLQISSNYWMAWSCPTDEGEPVRGIAVILLVYAVFAVGSSLCVLLRAILVAITGLLSAQRLFDNMQKSVLRAPMSFFDSTPAGRILNRASTDQSVVDLEVAQRLGWCAFSIIQILGTIAVMSQVAWEVFIIFIPVTAICIWYQRYYIPTARELARLEGIQRSPILHHFAESLSGAATIRAFGQKDRFMKGNLCLVDSHSRPWFHNVAAMEWLSFRLNQLSNFVFATSLIFLVTLPQGIIVPSIAGLAVTYGISLNVQQASVIWNICNAENKMISVERILQYSNLPSEAELVIKDSRPPKNWPEIGVITLKNLQIRYAEHLPSVLKNISCTFPGRKKVGVVGRTGSGKSTLIQAIFRIVEPREGSITIDGVDISKIGLHDLRSRLSIIPQDPTMFDGTVRVNLDPLNQYPDSDVWEALDKCQLGDVIRAKEEKLESTVVENGENWSVGQRQLFCLGRALLKKSSILVLDEATASVDSATDGIIQKIISHEFQHRTIVTIAHRIHTVIDSDFVLVLSEGRIAEYDTPTKLLEREDSFFSKLIKEYSLRSHSFGGSKTFA